MKALVFRDETLGAKYDVEEIPADLQAEALHRDEALLEALADGTIDAVATDHAPHSSLEKDCEFAEASPGMIGLELVVPLLFARVREGAVSLARLVDALTAAPARIIGLSPPSLRVGARAELCIVDPKQRWTVDPARLRSKTKNTPFLNKEVEGAVLFTLADGRMVYEAPAMGLGGAI